MIYDVSRYSVGAPSVLSSDGSMQTYFEAAMKTAAELMKSKVVESARDRVGVTLFGTQKTSATEASASAGIHVAP